MDKTKTWSNIKNIFIQSYRWRNQNLSDKDHLSKFTVFSVFNIILFISSIIIVLFVKKFNEAVLDSILTFTSIFATLIIPVLILVYEKFANNPNQNLGLVEQKSKFAKDRFELYKNFTNRFIFTTLENVFIATTLITAIILYKSFLSTYLSLDILDYSFDADMGKNSILLFLKLLLISLAKTLFTMLLMKFVWFLFYSIGALGDFFTDSLNESK